MRRMITGKDAEIFKNIAADGTKTVVSGDLDVSGNILKNGQPLASGTKLYKHEISGILSSNANARLIIYSTSSDLINDRIKLLYNTESFLRVSQVSNITASQRDVANVLDISFDSSAYKVNISYCETSTITTIKLDVADYTDTVTEL